MYARCSLLELSVGARTELEFWAESLHDFNSQPIWHNPGVLRVVYSDASSTGYGGYTVEHGMHVANGVWLPEEAKQSSTWRELVAVKRVLQAVVDRLNNSRIHWFTDNQNVVRILTVGRLFAKCSLTDICTLMSRAIHIEPEWIPREQNEIADYISCIVDYDDWFVNPAVFAWPGGQGSVVTSGDEAVAWRACNQQLVGDWPLLRDLQKPELQQLAAGLPDVVLSGRADSTTKKYLGAFQRWKHLSTSKHSRSAVEEVVHALVWVHKMAGIESPTESRLVQSVLAGLRRILSLRAGGATAAANAGVPDRLFKRHGCWRSESAKDGYVKDSVERRLSVSKSLGNAAQSLLSSHGLTECLRREQPEAGVGKVPTNPATGKKCCQVCSSFRAALGFVTQQKTAVGQHLLKDLCERVTQYVKSCNTKRERHHIVMHCIGNMDETATWADMPANDCQKQYICAITNNQARYAAHYHLTDGTKLSPFVVFKDFVSQSLGDRTLVSTNCSYSSTVVQTDRDAR
eukprot:Em0018g544a